MKKIALITPMLQPYRITFYSKLAFFDPEYEFRIFHGVEKTETGRPNFKGETSFQNTGLVEKKLFIGPFKIVVNKGLYGEIRKYDPDLVILQGIAGNISSRRVTNWASRNNKYIILWTCGWEPGKAKGKLLSLKNILVSVFFRKADMHLTYSTKANSYVESMGVLPHKIRTSYNGIEIDPLLEQEKQILADSEKVVEKYNLEGYITFLYVGGFIQEKRIDLLISAFLKLRRKHNNIKLIIIGDGPLKEEIVRTVNETKDPNIYYLGRIIDGVDPYFAAADCLVLPGVGGLSLNQGMFWRKTCIVSEADGTEDDLVLENETGFRFEKDNLESLTSAMERRILTEEDQIKSMSNKAREIILTKSNVNKMVEVFMTGVKDCLNS